MSNLTNEFDSFFNLEDETSSDIKPHYLSNSHQQSFPAPSYQYGDLRQQTGLPMGGLANTFAVNQANGLHYRPSNSGFVMPTETLNLPLSHLDEFDFNRPQFDMDLEADSPSDMPTMFYPGSSSQHVSPSTQTPQRIYPGMHTQQAAQAKAKQKEMLKQETQPKQLPGQQPLPSQTMKTPTVKDPHVEESISRLLSRMRQNSAVSTNGDDDDDSTLAGMSNMPRFKKDEDDMDEDERLLNSEEGKKLSSKERRQLRNKVSARAFRSRRKEYITQLEAEVAGKVQEANDLRVQNRQLMEENTRLTDLTRMLLSSQAFSGFLQELSASGGSTAASQFQHAQQQQMRSQPQQQTPSVPKDISSHDAARQIQNQNSQMQVGMTLIPETNFDMMDPTSWNMVGSNDYQVYSVAALPEPPVIDLSALSEKTVSSTRSSTKDLPTLPTIPVTNSESVTTVDDSVELDESTYDLYFTTKSVKTVSLELPASLSLQLTKAGLSSELISSANAHNEAVSLEKLCMALDESFEKISSYLPNGI